jgi:hypothetical protein
MKRNSKHMTGFLGIALMLAPLVGAATTSALPFQSSSSSFEQATPTTPAQKEIESLLKRISSNVTVVSKHDRLGSFTRPGAPMQYESHAAELMAARDAINAMGADLRQVQELRASALPWQQLLIDQMQPMLVEIAGHTTHAIEQLNAGSSSSDLS